MRRKVLQDAGVSRATSLLYDLLDDLAEDARLGGARGDAAIDALERELQGARAAGDARGAVGEELGDLAAVLAIAELSLHGDDAAGEVRRETRHELVEVLADPVPHLGRQVAIEARQREEGDHRVARIELLGE